LWCYLFIEQYGMQIKGVALAWTCTYILGTSLMLLYICIKKPRSESWFFFNSDSFKHLWSLFKREVPIGSMIYLEWIAFEITVLFSSGYTPEQMGGQIAFYNLCGILFYFPMGLGISFSAFVGNAIGEGNVKKLQKSLIATLCIVAVIIAIMEITLFCLQNEVFKFFTAQEDILEIARKLLMIYLLYLPADATQAILGGFLRAIGKEKLGSWAFLMCFYLIALPLAYILGNVLGYNVVGIRVGMAIGVYLIFLADIFIIWRSNYRHQSEMIQDRIKADHATCSFVGDSVREIV